MLVWVCENFWGWVCSVCVLGLFLVFVCGLGVVFVGLACALNVVYCVFFPC